jgi:NodT family efflux transporter outer membrane factor (OMF) lipoprotein
MSSDIYMGETLPRANRMTSPLTAIRIRFKPAPKHLSALHLALPLIILLVVGCSVGPKYRPPQSQLHPFHNAPSIEARKAGVAAPPLDTWWEGFHDAELTRIVQRALAENLDLAAALTRVEQARAAAKEAGARLKPSGALTAQSTSFRQSLESETGRYAGLAVPSYKRNQSYLDLGIAATWEIDLFGGLRRGAEAATNEAEAAQAEGLGTRVSIVAEAADAYMQIRGAQARLGYAKYQIATDEHLLQLVSQRRAAGIASDREQAQAEAVLSQARATIPQLNVILEAQLNRLDVLMGAQPGTYSAELSVPADIPIIPAITSLSDPADLLRRRPDVIAAERRLAASNARVGEAIAEYYPKISLSGFLGNEAISPGNLFRDKGLQPTAVAGLRWRLFDFGRVDAEVKQAKGANAEMLLQYRNSVLRAAEDVEDSFTLLAQSEMRGDELLREISSLQRVRDRSQEAYQAGVIPLTDVLDADRQLLVARDELAFTRETAAQAAVGSFRALGGGWAP